MRIAFVLNALRTGGAEIHTVTLAAQLMARGHDCLLVPLLAHDQVDQRGVPVAEIGGNSLIDRKALRRLGTTLTQFRPDVVVAVNGRPAAMVSFARMLGLAPRVPLTMIYHTTLLLNLKQRLQFLGNLPFSNRAETLVFVSGNQRAYCLTQGMKGGEVETIHNGIDGQQFNPALRQQHRAAMRAKLGLGEEVCVIGLSAAFRPEKNHAQAVEALAALRAQGHNTHLLLLGDGPGRAGLEAAVAAQGLAPHVTFAGRQSDVVPWLSAFDVGVLTSTAVETFSLAALEFMALGVPGVLSDIGGANEMVSDGRNGWVFPAGDTAALVAALARLADPALRAQLGEAAAQRVATEFTLETMVNRYEGLLGRMAACQAR